MLFRPQLTVPSCSHGRAALRRTCATTRGHPTADGRPRCLILPSPHEKQSYEGRRTITSEVSASTAQHVPSHRYTYPHPARTSVAEQTLNTSSKASHRSGHNNEAGSAANHERDGPNNGLDYKIRRYVAYDADLDEVGANDTEDTGFDYLPPGLLRSWSTAWEGLTVRLLEAYRSKDEKKMDLFREHCKFAEAFLSQLTAEQLREKWLSLSPSYKLNVAPALLIGSLLHSPARALFVLDNIDFPWDEFKVRMRCLSYLSNTAHTVIDNSPELQKSFKHQVSRCRPPEVWPVMQMKAAHLDILLRWSTQQDCDSIVHAILKQYPFAQTNIYSTILSHYIRGGHIEDCLSFLAKLPTSLFQNCSTELRNALKRLLSHDSVITTEAGTNFKILPQLLTLGFEPDCEVYNIVLDNALAQELHSVAWDLYHYLRDQKIEIDARCYSKLLRDAFSRGYVQGLDEVMTDIHESDRLSQDPYLIVYSMNIVRVISFFRLKSGSTEALTRMMGLYDRAWSREPLQPFGILGLVEAPAHDLLLPPPPAASLAFTLWSYILVQRSEKVVDNLWHCITQLIRDANPKTIKPFRTETVYNGFVLFYARKLGTLVQALKVVQYMIDHDLCQPSPRTWSLLVCGFLRHHQVDQAASVVRMMKARGLELEYVSEQHIPHEYSLADLETKTETELDETRFPAEIESFMTNPEEDAALRQARIEAEVMEDL